MACTTFYNKYLQIIYPRSIICSYCMQLISDVLNIFSKEWIYHYQCLFESMQSDLQLF